MIKNKLDSLNDGGTLKKGILYTLFFLITLVYSLEKTGFNILDAAVLLLASFVVTVWSSKSFSLMKDTDILFAPLFLVSGSFFAAVLPITRDELPVPGILSYGDGATFSRLFSLPSFWIMKLCGGSAEASVYFARFINIICCGFMIWFAIRSIPYCKSICAAVALLPSSMRSIATAAPQGATLATSMLFISLALRASYTKDTYIISKKYMFALTVSAFLMLFCNISSLPFISLLLMIPSSRFGNKKRMSLFFSLILIFVILCMMFWGFGAAEAVLYPIEGLSRSEQLWYVVSHPFFYISVLIRTLLSDGLHILTELFVTFPFSLNSGSDLQLPWPLAVSFLMCFLYIGYFDSGLSPRRERIIRSTGISFLVFTIFQLTFYYLARTPLGYETIQGIDGSVLLPVLMPACMFVKRMCKHPAAPQKNFTEALMILALANIATAFFVWYSL